MSMSDPIADLLTRIRNAQARSKARVSMPSSTKKVGICEVLKAEGYVKDFSVEKDGPKATLTVELKYMDGVPVIERLERVSRPGLRQYNGKDDLPKIRGGFGIAIVSTSHGLMTDHQAREAGQGGEVVCFVA
ncbi:MAG: 30S ribosomal protein S8 [bacterium]